MGESRRAQLAEETLRRFASALRSAQLYAPGHPLVAGNAAALVETLGLLHAALPSVTIGLIGEEIVVNDVPLDRAGEAMAGAMRRLRLQGVERVIFSRGVSVEEVLDLVRLCAGDRPPTGGDDDRVVDVLQWYQLHVDRFPHVSIGGLRVEKRLETTTADAAAVRQAYGEAVSGAEMLWRGAAEENEADAKRAGALIAGLAQMMAGNPAAVVALTALKSHDNYTFTHMVNVAILSMAQARGLGIDGPLLREIGLAAFMHDIGKVRVPEEILRKPSRLDDEELAVMRRHPVDGAEILRRTPGIPPLAPAVAFEHHMRTDGKGYPAGVARTALNVATQMTMIADIYDAMRSRRGYQQAFATERILAVLHDGDHGRVDQHLVRRFVQVLGLYPPGTLVRLDTGEVAVVLVTHPADPTRPRVRLVLDASGARYDPPFCVNLWQAAPGSGAASIAAPLDPAEHEIDPLAYL